MKLKKTFELFTRCVMHKIVAKL